MGVNKSMALQRVFIRGFHCQPALYGKMYHPKISQTTTKNVRLNINKLLENEKKKKEREVARRGPITSPKNPLLYDTNRTKVFNRKFMETIGLAMSQIPELIGHGITITQVNVKQDFSEVRVFWVSSKNEADIAQLFDLYNKDIRLYMKENSGLGRIPRIAFIYDNHYMMSVQMDRLFDRLNTGPDVSEKDSDPWKDAINLELRNDSLGIRKDEILMRIEDAMRKSQAVHRTQYSQDQFLTAYRETINRHGREHKLEVKSGIKKFLVSRKKAEQKVRQEIQHSVDTGDER